MHQNHAHVVIAIATFRRPRLLSSLLDAIDALDVRESLRVLVCDNDAAEQAGRKVVDERMASGFRFPVDCVIEPEQGISFARNALFTFVREQLECSYLALIDDDESPSKQWLTELLKVARATGADVVGGPVRSVFEADNVDPAVAACGQFRRKRRLEGPVPVILSTENVFLKRAALEMVQPPWFDHVFAVTGGEDADLFYRLKWAGAKFAWADSAEVSETVPADRSTRAWVHKRSFRRGSNTAWRALRRPHKLKSLSRILALGVGALVTFPLFWLLSIGSPVARLDAQLRVFRALGYFAGLGQLRIAEYRKIAGT